MQDFRGRLRRIGVAYKEALARIPVALAVNARYAYRLDATLLQQLLDEAAAVADNLLLEGSVARLWFTADYVEVAARRGAAQQRANLAQQSATYRTGRESVADIINSDPFRRRMTLTRARVFEDMRGLSGQVKADLSRLLTDGIGRGQGALEIGRRISAQLGVEEKRANRIARSEIPTALRRARLDEADDAAELYGLDSRELHLSAMSVTTRATHAARNGQIFTTDQQREWWSEDANSINCKCTTVTVMVDEAGDPLVPDIVRRVRERKMPEGG